MPKQGEIPTRTAKRPRPEDGTFTEGSDLQKGSGTYKEALTNVKIRVDVLKVS
jgi:hypothetical protein